MFAGSSEGVEWLLTWPGIGIAVDSSLRVKLSFEPTFFDASSFAVVAGGGADNTELAAGTDGSGADGTAG